MPPVYSFMTGATRYRVQAESQDEALRIAFEELNPTDDARALILQTIYDESEAERMLSAASSGAPAGDAPTSSSAATGAAKSATKSRAARSRK